MVVVLWRCLGLSIAYCTTGVVEVAMGLSQMLLLLLIVSRSDSDPCRVGKWFQDPTFKNCLPADVNTTSSIAVDSKLRCASRCQKDAGCNSFFYNDVSKMCVRQWMIYVSTDKTEFAFGWRYFRFTSDSCPRLHNTAEHENYVIDRVSVTCFRVVTSQWLPWVAARAACSSKGDRLAVLEPVEKARFVVDFLKINNVFTKFSGSFVIGASRPQHLWNTSLPASGPDLVWENGQRVNYTATAPFWYKDRPNNKDNTDNVLGMKANKNFLWDDLKESDERVYICERLLSSGKAGLC